MIRNFLRNFMIGRYGPDHLNVAVIVVALALYLAHSFFPFAPLLLVSYILLALSFFRMLSRNTIRRRAENDRFVRYWWPVRTRIRRFFRNIKYRRTHKLFKCPSCKNNLRVPRGKGKLQITCPKCGERFFKKS